ncbi:universal stress protein [Ktedonosporobacter rubrisoli]|uniref:Universal stress protein n=1 Tax=Ktedonosporobacter rubrisoli TaxID=2509675 RepID=A0A4P6JT58_KTERU|nr:universal stress protein [Ktedonosporobacter rubrisoli]QBD78748.1 universal stress protein [Ktedonosporobacter rubrisoli]
MFKRILVPLDSSKLAESALPTAAMLARDGGSICLVQVVGVQPEVWTAPGEYLPATMPMQNDQQVVEAARTGASQYLADIAASPSLKDIPTEIITPLGSPAPTILATAQSQNIDIIVLCSHGYTGVTRWIMGSVATKIVRHSETPVLVLRKDGPQLNTPGRRFSVLVPLDGSARSKAAIEPAASLVTALSQPEQGALHLLRVVKPLAAEQGNTQAEQQQIIDKAEQYLKTAAETVQQSDGTANAARQALSWSVALNNDIAGAIIQEAEAGARSEDDNVPHSYDAIAMATHGYGGWQHGAVGSIADRVLQSTRLPLLIVRPPDMRSNRQER